MPLLLVASCYWSSVSATCDPSCLEHPVLSCSVDMKHAARPTLGRTPALSRTLTQTLESLQLSGRLANSAVSSANSWMMLDVYTP